MPEGGSTAVAKALDLIAAVAAADGPLRLHDVAARTGLHRATVHRIAADVVQQGWLVREGNGYSPGPVLQRLARRTHTPAALARLTRPTLVELITVTGMMANVQMLEPDGSRLLDVVRPERYSMIADLRGELLPAHRSAGGLALVAHLPENHLQHYLDLAVKDGMTLSGDSGLLARLAEIRASGFSVSSGQLNSIISSISRPVRRRGGTRPDSARHEALCCLTVVGLTTEMTPEQQQLVSDALQQHADTLCDMLMGPPE